MTVTFESMVKISFEVSNSELQELHGALNSAYCAVMQKRDDSSCSSVDRQYYTGVCNVLERFVSNFNTGILDDKKLQ